MEPAKASSTNHGARVLAGREEGRARGLKNRQLCLEQCSDKQEKKVKRIQVLGPGCAKCAKLKENADQAVQQSGVEATVEKVEDINEITAFGVMMTPALAIDGQVKVVGKVPSAEEIVGLLR